jgi:hypothetical protein
VPPSSIALYAVSIRFLIVVKDRSERMGEHESADPLPLVDPIDHCRSEMDARIDAGIAVFLSRL